MPLAAAAVASPLQVVVGDWAGRDVARYQPVKLAAFEGLGTTTKGASVHVLGWYTGGDIGYGIAMPRVLSMLAKHDPNATVAGLDTVPAGDRPPVNVVRIAFQTMVGIGTLLAALGAAAPVDLVAPPAAAALALVLPRARARRPARGRGADRRLGDDGGGPTAVDRLPRDAHRRTR